MESFAFENVGQVIDWLKNKPFVWKKFVYSRWALRALPSMGRTTGQWLKFYSVSIFQANILAWASIDYPDLNTAAASELCLAALREAHRRAYDDNLAWDALVHAMGASLVTSGGNADHLFYWEDDPNLREVISPREMLEIPNSVGFDCKWLSDHQYDENLVPKMAESLLVGEQSQQVWAVSRFELWNKLNQADPNYSVWIDWYERRIRGERAAFDIPGDKGRIEDKKNPPPSCRSDG